MDKYTSTEEAYKNGYREGMREGSEKAWEVFSDITTAWHGKQYYFRNSDGSVYSRLSCKNIAFDKAVEEFADSIYEK